ncbi:MAG: branched-chain amino acid ABC transporter permease [Acidimicrobiales bacterium]
MAAITLPRRRSRNARMVADYRDDLRLFPSLLSKLGIAALVLVWVQAPLNLSDYQLTVLGYAGVAAIGAIGLNLLTGYTGQVSLGHGFFIAVGSYSVAYFGSERGLPLVAWLPIAAIIGGALGAAIGPFALRLRGNYLVVVTLGLLFVGEYVFDNWDSVTGSNLGKPTLGAIGTLDANEFELFGTTYTREQGYFWLVWFFVGVVALLVKNIVRSRPGRALQAIRERDLAAEVVGVSLTRYKIAAFAVSSAIAAVAGALFASIFRSAQWIDPPGAMLFLSIQYIAIIIIGGIGTIYGSVLGALLIGSLPQIIQNVTLNNDLPFVVEAPGESGFIEVASLNNLVYGLLIVVFLLLQPHGLAAVWRRIQTFFKTWPFSY